MANLVYKRVSTDQQSTDRQNLVLAEAGIEDPTARAWTVPEPFRKARREYENRVNALGE
ncbi:hypothetical protein [Streptomyces sp. NPDC057557]|uniref:hypothetical protein n=1 Tax=Streptomyces sp. NPDC057557 TaxID=3346167 RepID=UPI0036A8A405